jgi:hypothetical protein
MLNKRKPATENLEGEIVALRTDQEAAAAEARTLSESRKPILLNGTDDDLRRVDDAIATAERRRDRAAARLEQAEQQLADVRTQAVKDEQAALERDADAAADAAAKLMAESLTKIRDLTHGMLRAAAAADRKVIAANQARDPNEIPLQLVEARARSQAPMPRKVLTTETVELWTYERTGDRVPAENIGRISDRGGGRGRVEPVGMSNNFSPVVKRRFQRTEFLPAVVPNSYVRPLARAITIPGLLASDPEIWKPIDSDDPGAILTALAEMEAAAGGGADRKPVVEFVALDDVESHANAAA